MNNHKAKLKKLFEYLIPNNIDVTKLIHALEHYGAIVDKTKWFRVVIHINGASYPLALTHRKELYSRRYRVHSR